MGLIGPPKAKNALGQDVESPDASAMSVQTAVPDETKVPQAMGEDPNNPYTKMRDVTLPQSRAAEKAALSRAEAYRGEERDRSGVFDNATDPVGYDPEYETQIKKLYLGAADDAMKKRLDPVDVMDRVIKSRGTGQMTSSDLAALSSVMTMSGVEDNSKLNVATAMANHQSVRRQAKLEDTATEITRSGNDILDLFNQYNTMVSNGSMTADDASDRFLEQLNKSPNLRATARELGRGALTGLLMRNVHTQAMVTAAVADSETHGQTLMAMVRQLKTHAAKMREASQNAGAVLANASRINLKGLTPTSQPASADLDQTRLSLVKESGNAEQGFHGDTSADTAYSAAARSFAAKEKVAPASQPVGQPTSQPARETSSSNALDAPQEIMRQAMSPKVFSMIAPVLTAQDRAGTMKQLVLQGRFNPQAVLGQLEGVKQVAAQLLATKQIDDRTFTATANYVNAILQSTGLVSEYMDLVGSIQDAVGAAMLGPEYQNFAASVASGVNGSQDWDKASTTAEAIANTLPTIAQQVRNMGGVGPVGAMAVAQRYRTMNAGVAARSEKRDIFEEPDEWPTKNAKARIKEVADKFKADAAMKMKSGDEDADPNDADDKPAKGTREKKEKK